MAKSRRNISVTFNTKQERCQASPERGVCSESLA
jgi:hypothetical protein